MRLKASVVAALIHLYPAEWRREYGNELAHMLLMQPLGISTVGDVLWNATLQRTRTVTSRHRIRPALLVAVGLLAALLLGTIWTIESGVHAASDAALNGQSGDPVRALMNYADSAAHPLRQRNRAVWALGQLGDARALTVLNKHFTGETCNHAQKLCQYELRKAIGLCRGGTNVTAGLWR